MAPESNVSLPRLIRACRKEVLDRPPVWLMRQAGRYMPEYQAMRKRYSFLELCKAVDAAVEVTLQPIHAFGMDGAIMFSDILVPVEAMGLEVRFTESKGPELPSPVRTPADIDRLIIPDPVEKTGFVGEILKQLRQELSANFPETALIGFSGAPWTLAAYMIEGGGSKNFIYLKSLMHNDPMALHRLLQKITATVERYLQMQVRAGAQVVQLFDTWAGIVTIEQYREFILPYHRQIIECVRREKLADGSSVPVILYVNSSRGLLPMMAEANPDVISVDFLTSIIEARRLVGEGFCLQGNLDPAVLFTRPDVLKSQVETLAYVGGNKGYIFNLGHGVLPGTPVENVKLLVDTIKSIPQKSKVRPETTVPAST